MLIQYISLLRGINVGGHRQIKMVDLKGLYESLGLEAVQVILQTGNVLFKSAETDPAKLVRQLEAACEKQFGFHTHIMILTGAELKKIVDESPLTQLEGTEPKWTIVTFLSGRPDSSGTAALLKYEGPEALFVTDSAVYIYYTEGAGRSKLTNALIEKRLNLSATARNWNTVTKMLALAEL